MNLNFYSIISFHALKLALNKSMYAYDNEQGINKLRPEYAATVNVESNQIWQVPLKTFQ